MTSPDVVERLQAEVARPEALGAVRNAQIEDEQAGRAEGDAARAFAAALDAEYLPTRRAPLQRIGTAAEALAEAVRVLQRADAEHKAHGGGGGWEIPFAEVAEGGALTFRLDRLQRAIAGPRPKSPAPPPAPGQRRLRLLTNLHDAAAFAYRLRGDVADFDDAMARDLVKRKIAVEVEAGV